MLCGSVRADGDGLGAMGLSYRPIFVFFMLDCGANKSREERMRFERFGFELGMELAAEEPWMIRSLDDLDVILVGSASGDAKTRAGQNFFVVAIEFVAMTMAFADFGFAIRARGKRAGFELAGPCAEPHRAAHFIDA